MFSIADSFIFMVEYSDPERDPFQDLANMASSLDLSCYSAEHPIFTHNPDRVEWLRQIQKDNNGVLGLLKDECGDHFLRRVICLRCVVLPYHDCIFLLSSPIIFFLLFVQAQELRIPYQQGGRRGEKGQRHRACRDEERNHLRGLSTRAGDHITATSCDDHDPLQRPQSLHPKTGEDVSFPLRG